MNSFWIESIEKIKSNGDLEQDTSADVCIIGAGICGLTTAYYLTKKGYKVLVIEKGEIGHGTTGFTTAKITSQHGLIYHYLSKKYGIKVAKKYFEINEEAINNIEQIIRENNISCDFERKDSYIYTSNEEEKEKILEEAEALKYINLESELVEKIDLPFRTLCGVKFKNQAQFNPLKYIEGLVEYILKHGGRIYTNTLCTDIKRENEEYVVYANSKKVYSKYVVLACGYPFLKVPGFYFAKMYQASSYVIGIETKSKLPEGMYINVENPTYSIRTAKLNEGKDILLLGGAGHKTGEKVNEEQTYGILEKKAKEMYPDCKILYKWSTRDAVTLDKIAYIGEYSSLLPNMYIATGFNKWGMTTSNVAANIITEKITNNGGMYDEIFKSTRMEPITNKGEMKNMIVDASKSFVVDRIKETKITLDDIQRNSGGIIEINGEKIGVYKDEKGHNHYVKPVCTHLGCMLEWNDADKTWDCPCHGSRFDRFGIAGDGPAIKNLENLETLEPSEIEEK